MSLRHCAGLGGFVLACACRVQVNVGDAPLAGGASAGSVAAMGGSGGAAGSSAVASTALRPPCVDPSAALLNSGFEAGSADVATGWLGSAVRVSQGAHSGFYALAISKQSDEPSSQSFRQKLALAPYTPYVLRGWMRAERARDLGAPRFFAEISADPYFLASTGPASAVAAASEWQLFELDFETGYDGDIEVSGRLNGAGSVYFDDLSIACNTNLKRYQSPHFILDLRPDQERAVGADAVQGVVDRSELVIRSIAQLTGQDAAPEGYRQAAWGPKWFEQLGWRVDEPGGAGYPFLWSATPSMLADAWRRNDYVPESFVLAIAQNFASPAWNFELSGSPESHGANALVAYHAYETLKLASVYPSALSGADNRKRFSEAYDTYWSKRRCARSDALAYRDILLVDRIGWAPFEQAYRALGAATDLRTPWRRVEAFHQTLAAQSARQVSGSASDVAQDRALFSSDEWNDVRRYYDRSLNVEFPAPALVEANVRQLPLALAEWESAATDWGQPARNTLVDGCPLATQSATYARGLWAHAASSYLFQLGGAWQSLSADYGLPFGVSGGSVRFDVLGDGKTLFSSARIADAQSHQFSISLAGVQRLELRTETPSLPDGSVDETSAWGVWFEPTLLR